MPEHVPRVVIVGGGFGGLAAAKALGRAPVRALLVDRNNHHLFQPLLYQVATSVLTPAQIGSPIRGILRKQRNTTVILGEVTGVDKDRRCIFVNSADREGVSVPYDVLILATGVRHSYFGHDEFVRFAPGLKNLADAVAIRNRVLKAFEQAEAEEDPRRHGDLLTFVLVGAGPTGVEMASAMADLVSRALRAEFRRIDPTSARIVRVEPDLTAPGHPEIFVIGDTASLAQDGRPLPGVAQVAMQQGRYAGTLIHRRIGGQPKPRPFRYFDKGNMAVVGKGFAVLESGRLGLSGFLAWMAWAAVHLEFLAQSSLRVSVFVQWVWTYLTGQRGSRLIVNHHASVSDDARTPSSSERQPMETR